MQVQLLSPKLPFSLLVVRSGDLGDEFIYYMGSYSQNEAVICEEYVLESATDFKRVLSPNVPLIIQISQYPGITIDVNTVKTTQKYQKEENRLSTQIVWNNEYIINQTILVKIANRIIKSLDIPETTNYKFVIGRTINQEQLRDSNLTELIDLEKRLNSKNDNIYTDDIKYLIKFIYSTSNNFRHSSNQILKEDYFLNYNLVYRIANYTLIALPIMIFLMVSSNYLKNLATDDLLLSKQSQKTAKHSIEASKKFGEQWLDAKMAPLSRSGHYLTELSKLVPNGVSISEIELYPIRGSSKSENTFTLNTFSTEEIRIRGSATSIKLFKHFIEKVAKSDYFIGISHSDIDQTDTSTNFEIKVSIER